MLGIRQIRLCWTVLKICRGDAWLEELLAHTVLLLKQLSHPSQLQKEYMHTCTACGSKLRWTGLISPLGWFEPVVWKEGTATGLILTVSGQLPAHGVSSQLDAGTPPG